MHVYDADAEQARWHPLPRPQPFPTQPGTVLVVLHQGLADLYGDDPTNPSGQTEPRQPTAGMIGRLNIHLGDRNVRAYGVRG